VQNVGGLNSIARRKDRKQIGKYMNLDLSDLQYEFLHKPLLIGGKAMEYYNLRKAGNDIDLVVHLKDHSELKKMYPHNIKDIYGDIGVCEYGYEIWNQICTFKYDFLKESAIEENSYLVLSLEKMMFLKALAMKYPKYHKDLELIVERVLSKAYGKA
jgi:hypothetical protein